MSKDLKFELELIQNYISENAEKIEEEKIEKFNDFLKEFKNENSISESELSNFINEFEDEYGHKKRFVKLYKNVIDFEDIISTVDKLKQICKIKSNTKKEPQA